TVAIPGDFPALNWESLVTFTPWLIYLLWVISVLYVSVFVHELGHAVMGWRNGFVVSSFGLGFGRPFLRFRCRGTLIYFRLRPPTQGVTFTVARRLIPSRRARAAMLLGGVLANGLFGLLAWGLWWLLPAGNTLCLILASLNTITAVGNLIPFSIHR